MGLPSVSVLDGPKPPTATQRGAAPPKGRRAQPRRDEGDLIDGAALFARAQKPAPARPCVHFFELCE